MTFSVPSLRASVIAYATAVITKLAIPSENHKGLNQDNLTIVNIINPKIAYLNTMIETARAINFFSKISVQPTLNRKTLKRRRQDPEK
jgi:hypothetical protein